MTVLERIEEHIKMVGYMGRMGEERLANRVYWTNVEEDEGMK